MMIRSIVALMLLGLLTQPAFSKHLKLAPFKNDLFAYPSVLERSFGDDYLRIDYDKARDIFERDEIPRRRAKRQYVNERVRWSRRVMRYRSPSGSHKMFAVGNHKGGAKVTVIYLYGQGGNRFQGVNDWTFGGNFNRLQNLMTRNQGLLLTPDYSNFGKAGTMDILSLMTDFRVKSPETIMIVACGSMGGAVCWQLLANPAAASQIDGMFFLGTRADTGFLKSSMLRKGARRIPLYFAHGSSDNVFSPKQQISFFRSLKKASPNYPARFIMFNNGVHGTPVRMVDWWRELNWMLQQHH